VAPKKPTAKPKSGKPAAASPKPVAKVAAKVPVKAGGKPVATKPAEKPVALPPVVAPVFRSIDGRRHVLSLSFLRDGDEFMARMESDSGQITELKNRSLDQLLTLVASELEDLLE